MVVFRRYQICGVALAIALASASPTQAGVFRNVVRGLEYAGFRFAGQENPVSGGSDFVMGRTFNGDTLDFGATDLTLTGPLNFTLSTGGRNLGVLEFSLNSGNQAFEYILNSSSGAQDYTVDGNFLLDATGSINSFGFYDLRLQLSSRQDVLQDGRFLDGAEELDYDIGPIDVSGNIFADLLARLFDPVFDALGAENIFDSFSGRGQADLFELMSADAQAKSVPADLLTADDLSEMLSVGEDVVDPEYFSPHELRGRVVAEQTPEPQVLMLLLAPAAYFIGRRYRG
ncbi:MAG: hypothetical protein GY842_09040 [bacterium]|nr:hypothetical protein [bacterium]